MTKKFVSKTDEMDQQRLISLSHEKCAQVASEHRREMLVTAAGADRLNVADKNSWAKILTSKGRDVASSPFIAQATVWLLGHTSAENLWGLSQ